MRILLVDDEAELTTPLTQILTREGYRVEVADHGQTGMNLALTQDYDLLILDWMLPYYSGIQITQALRKQQKTTPVLLLTAKDTLGDRVTGLDAGADDYLLKPFELPELLARVRALLRRGQFLVKKLKFADLELDTDNQLAYRQGRMIKLSEKEIKLLGYFMDHPNQLLTHEQIYQYLWSGEEKPSSNVLAALIRLLRRKIEAKGETQLIHTVYGRGYCLAEFPDDNRIS
ncbi:two-component system response regulator RppA [Gloeocapsa sp. PCC 73106]|uniref:two-component system response regulator RppA n=1 Tax=Gloeocapsa sp. PCC 73106 TaxID=102232 RepID=UPI0002AC611A|nr:two-component system response regulator RppA [Gloeocapsa sp. PCC 73106]ELR98567.1 response regulator with CheY-like receiver domain and winged-helix DNA-binding domain [Gloeocapsa sp. PCC 73106]